MDLTFHILNAGSIGYIHMDAAGHAAGVRGLARGPLRACSSISAQTTFAPSRPKMPPLTSQSTAGTGDHEVRPLK